MSYVVFIFIYLPTEYGGAISLADYSSSIHFSGSNMFRNNQASFGAVFSGKGFVRLGEGTEIRNNLAMTPVNALSSLSLSSADTIGFGGVYWYSGTKPPDNVPSDLNNCRYLFHKCRVISFF